MTRETLLKTLKLMLLSLFVAAATFFGISVTAVAEEGEGEEKETYTVIYNCGNGYVEIDGEKYTMFSAEYEPDSFFNPIVPTPFTDQYLFAGWFTRSNGRGEQYTKETVIDRNDILLYGAWKANPETIPPIIPDTVYSISLPGGSTMYQFTPSETAAYEVNTSDNDPYVSVATIRLYNEDLVMLADSGPKDYDYNAVLSSELTAGVTYYFAFSDASGSEFHYNVILTKSEFADVTFHANRADGGAYFDGDPAVTVKTVPVRKGAHLESYRDSGLTIAPSVKVHLAGWSLDPGAEYLDPEIILSEPVDLYAVYDPYWSVTLDANGGYFRSFQGDYPSIEYTYKPEEMFGPAYDPEIDDEHLMFAGWASTKDAAEPEITNGMPCGELPDVLYAVYTEIVTVTFDALDGNIYENPNLHVLTLKFGKGHVFDPIYVSHSDPYVVLIGWRDQHGVLIPDTRDSYPDYRYTEDTYLTAVWGRYVTVDANGACFKFNPNLTQVSVLLPRDGAFYSSYIIDQYGEPINFNDLKYLAGWTTSSDAEEPDVTDGTDAGSLTIIYAVWKDDTYYLYDGAGQSWEPGSTEGLTFTVKRSGDDTMTFSCFTGVKVDGENVEYPLFTRREGSNILTLTPEYLETLDAGEHTVRMEFTEDQAVEAQFTVTESGGETGPGEDETDPSEKETDPSEKETDPSDKETDPPVPDTGDRTDLGRWTAIMILGLAGIIGVIIYSVIRKRNG